MFNMTKMDYSKLRLRDPYVEPTDEVLREVLGESYAVYQKFQKALGGLELKQEWTYYNGCGKSWMAKGIFRWTTSRGTKKEKVIYWSSAWDGYFCVTIWFKEKNRAEVLKVEVSEKTKRLIREAKMLGKMPTFPVVFEVTTDEPLADIYKLIECKKRLEK